MPPDSVLVYLSVIAAGVAAAVNELRRARRRRKRRRGKPKQYQDFLN